MINAKKFDTLTTIQDGKEVVYNDVMVIPVWLLQCVFNMDDMLSKEEQSLTHYGKELRHLMDRQNSLLSINTER